MSKSAADWPGHATVLALIKQVKTLESARKLFIENLCAQPKYLLANELDEFTLEQDDKDEGTVILTPLGKIGLLYERVVVNTVRCYEITFLAMPAGAETQELLKVRFKANMSVSLVDGNWMSFDAAPATEAAELQWRDLRVSILDTFAAYHP